MRSQHERESLIFPSVEKGQEFTEKIKQEWQKEPHTAEKKKEVVHELLSHEFEKQGEAVGTISQPWDHTPEEHTEAQQLVDIAFAQDLLPAIKKARTSKHYPRNLDLMHDVLTEEMYAIVSEHHLNRQPLRTAIIVSFTVVLVCLLLIFILLFVV